jgi:hypothetical protein
MRGQGEKGISPLKALASGTSVLRIYMIIRRIILVLSLISRHWPLDLIHLHSIISRPLPSSSSSGAITPPLRLRLHLSNPPIDKLNLPNGADQCRTQWVNQVKEADFVRWRNTSRTTGLRKGDFDAGWDGIVNGMSFSSRLNGAAPCEYGRGTKG